MIQYRKFFDGNKHGLESRKHGVLRTKATSPRLLILRLCEVNLPPAMTAFALPELPPDLAAKAAEVPGLDVRLLMFIRQEVALHERRQSRYSVQAREIVRQAEEQAAAEKDSGVSVEERRAEFLKLYEKIIDQIPVSKC